MEYPASDKRPGLTGGGLKLIAIVCMLIDHIAWAFIPTVSAAGIVMHTLGRITAPVMCFMLAKVTGTQATLDDMPTGLRYLLPSPICRLFCFWKAVCGRQQRSAEPEHDLYPVAGTACSVG